MLLGEWHHLAMVYNGHEIRLFEYRTANMEERIKSARLCQKVGYPVRFRLSPIIPVLNWEKENRELIEMIFSETQPDVITFETLRFMNIDALKNSFDTSLLDPEFISAMTEFKGQKFLQGCEIPHWYREKVYRFIIDELERVIADMGKTRTITFVIAAHILLLAMNY